MYFNKNQGKQYTIRDGDVETDYIRRPDGSMYAHTRAVSSASAGWACGGIVLFFCSLSSFLEARQGAVTGLIKQKSKTVYRTDNPVKFEQMLQSDQQTASVTAILACFCIAIAVALWLKKKINQRKK